MSSYEGTKIPLAPQIVKPLCFKTLTMTPDPIETSNTYNLLLHNRSIYAPVDH